MSTNLSPDERGGRFLFVKRILSHAAARVSTLWPRNETASIKLLSFYYRLVPAENQRLFVLTVIIGAVCGLAAVAFHLTIKMLEGYLINRAFAADFPSSVGWMIACPTLGGLVCCLLLYYVVPGARGSGIPQVKASFVLDGDRIPVRDAIGKFFIGAIQIGSGSSLGREGPTVQICAGIAGMIGRAGALSRKNLRRLLPVGAAAGIAAAFNAPIAAVTFTIEEVIGHLDQTILSGVIVAAALAAVIERNVLGEHPVLEVLQVYGLHHAASLILYTVLGVVSAVVSIFFTDALLNLRLWFRQARLLPGWAQPAVGGAVTGILAVAALLWLHTSGITGGGYETLSVGLAGKLTIKVMLALGFMKFIATLFSYSSGGAGGIFAPALFIGSMVGGVVGYVDVAMFGHPTNEVGAFALVGMGAVFAGIIRAPITSVLIIIEMTGGYSLILPLMIANMICFGLARHWRPVPVYEALLAQDGIFLPHAHGSSVNALDQLKVADAMRSRNLVSLRSSMTILQAFELIAIYDVSSFPVVDDHNTYCGLVSEAQLRRMLAEGKGDLHLQGILYRHAELFPEDSLVRAVILMKQNGTRQLAVTDRARKDFLLGMLTMSDIIRAQTHAAAESAAAVSGEPVFMNERYSS